MGAGLARVASRKVCPLPDPLPADWERGKRGIFGARRPAPGARRSALRERALDDVLALAVAASLLEAARLEQRDHVLQHRGAAADHDAVVLGVQGRQAEVGRQLAALEQGRDAPLVAEGLARDGRVVEQLLARAWSPISSCRGSSPRCSSR